MARLTIIVGMPGSGKSTLIESLASEYDGVHVPDYWKHSIGGGGRFVDGKFYKRMIRDLRSGKDCIIADVEFCDPARVADIQSTVLREAPDTEFDWKYFENDPEQCKINAVHRARTRVSTEIETIQRLTQIYRPPSTMPVFRRTESGG